MGKRTGLIAAVTALGMSASFLAASPTAANELVAGYLGSWGGKGKLVFKNGSVERISCRAYNTRATEKLRLALRCASPGYKIEIRSRLNVDGRAMTGTWEERTYNVTGAVRGTVATNQISLNVDGGAMRGDMEIAKSGNALAVDVRTTGIDLKSVSVRLARLN